MNDSPGSWLFALILVIGVTARLTRLVTRDTITAPLRARAIMASGDPDHWWPTLLRCPWCAGMWLCAPAAVYGYLGRGHWWFTVPAMALTASQATGAMAAQEG